MENRQGFIFYFSFYEALSDLPEQNQLELYKAIAEYSFTFTEPTDLTGVSKAMWKLIKPQLDANNKRYFNGKKQKGSKTEANEKQNESKLEAKEKEKEKEKDKEKEKIKDNHPTDEFDEALDEFVLMRKKIKKPITEKGIELIKDKLNKMYPNDKQLQIKCLYKSIENSWQGVFELSEQDIKGYTPKKLKNVINSDPNKVLSLNELIGKSEN